MGAPHLHAREQAVSSLKLGRGEAPVVRDGGEVVHIVAHRGERLDDLRPHPKPRHEVRHVVKAGGRAHLGIGGRKGGRKGNSGLES